MTAFEQVRRTTPATRSSINWRSQPGRMDTLNLRAIYPSANEWGIPDLAPTDYAPEVLAAWHDPKGRAEAIDRGALHFFLDDYRFERVWARPEAALDRVREVGAALTPDFSLWLEMPLAAQLWQVYRARWVGAFWQEHGITAIPTAAWSTPESFDFCFDGIAVGGTVAVSSVGVHRDPVARSLFKVGLSELLDRCAPSRLLLYGRLPDDCAGLDLPVIHQYPTWWESRQNRTKGASWADEAQASLAAEP